MGITEELNKKKAKEDLNKYAISLYQEQLKDITNIAGTKGYKEIKKYWEREVESIKAQYPRVKENDLYRLQEKDNIATSFLRFLENLENAKKINKIAKS